MLNSKQKQIVTIFLAVMLTLSLFISGLAVINVKAENTNNSYPSVVDNGKYDAYTDMDEHNSILLNNYKHYYPNGVTIVDGDDLWVHMQVERDNEIVYFVPKELFQKEGINSYIGKEYGFLTDTFAVSGSDALHTIVLLFDIEKNDNFYETIGHLKIRISPVFQGEFAYVTPETKVIKNIDRNREVIYQNSHSGSIYVDMATDGEYVVPVPTSYLQQPVNYFDCYFEEVNKYYLKNLSSVVSLYNENHLNSFDEGYNINEDKGAFFTQTDFAFSGHKFVEGKVSLLDLKDVFISMACIGLDIFNIAAKRTPNPLISLAGDVAGFIKNCVVLANKAMDKMEPTEKGLTYIPDYTTAAEQIAHKGYLTKDALLEVLSGENGDLLLGTEDYIEVDYQISATDPSWRTRYATALTIEATTLDGTDAETIKISNVPYSDSLNQAISKENINQSIGKETDVYLLPHGRQNNLFNPKYTGWYTFTTDFIGSYYSKITDTNDPSKVEEVETVYNESKQGYQAYLQAGHNYIWEIGYADDQTGGQQKCLIQFDPQTIVSGNNILHFENSASEYMQLSFDENYYYCLSSSDQDAMFHLYDKYMNEIKSGNTLRIENGNGEIVYISISFENSVTKDISILCTKERDVMFVTYSDEEIPPHTIINDASYILPTPENVAGRTFVGWWSNEYFSGNPVTDENLHTLNLALITLYANWEAIQYSIVYNENGGTEIPDDSYTVDDFVRLNTNIGWEGHIFLGWYDNELFNGAPVTTILQGSTGNRIYFAKWVKTQYTFTLTADLNLIDGQGVQFILDESPYSSNQYTVNYGESYRLPIAESTGFMFEGWYYDNTQITDSQGYSITDFAFEENMEIQAKFIRESYKIKLVINDAISYWLIQDGISKDEAFIEYSANLCPNCMVKLLKNTNSEYAALFFRDGYIYDCLTTVKGDNTKLACWHSFSQELVNGAEYTVYAYYIPELYQIYFENVSGERTDYLFNETIEYPVYPKKNGFEFLGWFDDQGKKFAYTKMPDLTPGTEGNGSISVVPKENPIYYNINYETNGGIFSGGTPGIYTVIDTTFSLPTPKQEGYRFMGWYEKEDFVGNIITEIPQGSTGDKTFYARWEKEYELKIFYQNNELIERYSVITNESIELPKFDNYGPKDKTEYYGLWTIKKGTEILGTFKLSEETDWTFEYNFDLILSFEWKGNIYAINYLHTSFMGQTAEILVDDIIGSHAPTTYEYGVGLGLSNITAYFQADSPYSPHMRFMGWYLDSDFTKRVTRINAYQIGTISLYAKWRYDQDNPSRYGTYTITDADPYSTEYYDQIYIGMQSNNLYWNLKNVGIEYLAIKLSLRMWEIDDGYQEILIYDGPNSTDNRIWSNTQIEHGPGKVDKEHRVYETTIFIDIDDIQDCSYLYIRYGANGNKTDNWQNDHLYLELMYTAIEDDSELSSPEFIWHYQYPFD